MPRVMPSNPKKLSIVEADHFVRTPRHRSSRRCENYRKDLTDMQSTAQPVNKVHLSRADKQTSGRNRTLSNIIPGIAETQAARIEFPSPVPDVLLVTAAKNGDESAFESLVERHERKLFALAFRYTRIREDAEDVVQQTFHKAFIHLNGFEGKSTFSTWLIRIAINEALMCLRRTRALREVPIGDSSREEGNRAQVDIADASSDPEMNYLQRERTRTLSMAIKRLTPNVRIVLELKELGELSMRETARHMGLSLSAVKARIFKGRKKLRKDIVAVQGTRSQITRQ